MTRQCVAIKNRDLLSQPNEKEMVRMTLQREMDDFRKNSPHPFSPEERANIDQFKNRLEETVRTIPAVGSTMPAFSLPDENGHPILSTALLEKSDKLYLTFFRGSW